MVTEPLTVLHEPDGTIVLRTQAPVSAGKGKGHRFKLYERRTKDPFQLQLWINEWLVDPIAWVRVAGWTSQVDNKTGKQIPGDIEDLGL